MTSPNRCYRTSHPIALLVGIVAISAIHGDSTCAAAREDSAPASAAAESEKYDKAIAESTEAIRLAPKNATLAAAYAESGDFQQVIEWQSKAIELGGARKEINDYRQRLELYKQGKPYREAPTAEATDGKRP